MKLLRFKGQDGKVEVGTWNIEIIKINIEARNIDSAVKKFNKEYPKILKEDDWTLSGGIMYDVYSYNPDTERKEYLQTMHTNN